MATAAYDEIADWYETEFLPRQGDADPLGTTRALRELLGHPDEPGRECLEVGCGTGVHAGTVRQLGWAPVGVDISAGMLRHAVGRMPVVRADVERLPFASGTVPAVIAVWVHTDMPAYPTVVREVARVLRPGGLFVHIGTHPCFCGGFADRSDREAVVIRPGYLNGHWTKASYTDQGIRDKVGATHWPLPALLSMVTDAGLRFERFTEGGEPSPVMFGWAAAKPDSRKARQPAKIAAKIAETSETS